MGTCLLYAYRKARRICDLPTQRKDRRIFEVLSMISTEKRGGPRSGAGRKPKSKTGALMKTRAMRWTDDGWADVLLIGADRVRELVAKEAARVRKLKGKSSMASLTTDLMSND